MLNLTSPLRKDWEDTEVSENLSLTGSYNHLLKA